MSHFRDIGFDVERKEDIMCLFSEVRGLSRKQEFGKYIQYITDDGSGARLYWYFRKGNLFRKEEFLGITPAFQGSTSQHIRDPEFKPNQEWPLEPSLDLWINNSETNEEYPLIVDVVNYLEVQNKDFTKLSNIKATLFANTFEYYQREEEFWKQYPKKNYVHVPAPGMFIPTGTFSPNDNQNFKSHAECWCYGKVIKSQKLVNQITKNEFYHFVMETYAANYDIVTQIKGTIDLKQVTIIGGIFWPCAIL